MQLSQSTYRTDKNENTDNTTCWRDLEKLGHLPEGMENDTDALEKFDSSV